MGDDDQPNLDLETISGGDQIGSLRVEREIGRGAFATVYLATDLVIGRRVALKVLTNSLGGDSSERERMMREVRLMGRLSTPYVVTIYHLHDRGPHGAMLEMEFVDGESLSQALDSRGRPPLVEALRVMGGVCSALVEAHGHDVIHRDLKPGNVLLGRTGQVKLADFGLGRQIGEASISGSGEGKILGTPLYLAPEIVSGGRASFASDIWGAGVLLYELLAGRRPFDAANLPKLFQQIERADPAPLPEPLPAPLREIVSRCLSKEVADRPDQIADVLDVLEDVASRSSND